MKKVSKMLPLGLYPPLDNETCLFYLIKHNYVLEVVPLHSRARSKPSYKSILPTTIKSYNAPVEEYRYYYGESIAIYFIW